MDATSICLLVGWFSLHVGALVCAWATRLVTDSRLELLLQFGFFAAMGGVGGSACVCRHLELGVWTVSAVILVAMVLTVIVDFRRAGESVQAVHHAAVR